MYLRTTPTKELQYILHFLVIMGFIDDILAVIGGPWARVWAAIKLWRTIPETQEKVLKDRIADYENGGKGKKEATLTAMHDFGLLDDDEFSLALSSLH